jgi:hypothetical protein
MRIIPASLDLPRRFAENADSTDGGFSRIRLCEKIALGSPPVENRESSPPCPIIRSCISAGNPAVMVVYFAAKLIRRKSIIDTG